MSEVQEVKKPRYSYTALSQFQTCEYAFYLKYVAKRRSDDTALHLELGNLAHKVKELISKDLMAGIHVDYQHYQSMLLDNGYRGMDKTEKREEILLSCADLYDKYPDEWMAPDTKSGMTYDEKLDIFLEHLRDEEKDTEWKTIGAEVGFEVPFEDALLFGVIDKIQENDQGQLRIVDYKTSKKQFSDSEIKTPLQMVVYHLAVRQLYPRREIKECLYDFVFLGQTQLAGSKGWVERGEKKLQKLIASIDEAKSTDLFKPSPSPLCHWCDYCKHKERANDEYSKLCPYYSLWLPNCKTYEVNRPYQGEKAGDILKGADERKKFWF